MKNQPLDTLNEQGDSHKEEGLINTGGNTELETSNIEQRKEEFLEKIKKFREKEKFYNEEKIRLNKLLETLREELGLIESKEKTKEIETPINEETLPEEKKEEVIPVADISEEELLIQAESEKSTKKIEKSKQKNHSTNNKILEGDKTKKIKEGEAEVSLDKTIDEIPNKEKELLVEAMREDTPLEFESPKVKTNYKDYFKNSIVKFYSGLKISSKIRGVIERNAKKLLLTTAVLTIWTNGGSFIKAEGAKMNSLKNKDLVDATKNKILEIGDLKTYAELSENSKSIYLYEMSQNNNKNYLIADKTRAEMYVIGKDGKLLGKFPILLGQTKGEFTNLSDPDSDVAGKYATTPAGKYILARNGLSVMEEDLKLYDSKIMSMNGGHGLAIHIVYPKELIKRMAALETPTPDDNRMSWGCINISKKMWIKYIQDNFKGTESLYITTDFPEETSLNAETGKVERTDKNNILTDTFFMTTNSSGKTFVSQKTEKIKKEDVKKDKDNKLFAMNNINN